MPRLKRLLRAVISRYRNEHLPWVVEKRSKTDVPLDDFRMYGIIASWMEEDIVGATVRNARLQGCDEVFLIDNLSSDLTVERATDAGATLWCEFGTPQYDERLRISLVNDLMSRVSLESSKPVWWLLLDADEFPHGPNGLTVRDYLRTLDRRHRVVGCRYLNHFPTSEPHYESGRHPLKYQPMAELFEDPRTCSQGHRKHNLLLQLPGAKPIRTQLGFHIAKSEERPLQEPPGGIIVHHFPFRTRESTVNRLDLLCQPDENGTRRAEDGDIATAHIRSRQRTAHAVYNGDWQNVESYAGETVTVGVSLRPWTELVSRRDTEYQSF